MIEEISEITQRARNSAGVVAVACAHDIEVIKAVTTAYHDKLARPILIGKAYEIEKILKDLKENPSNYEIIDKQNDEEAAQEAVKLAANNKANCLMKGLLPTSTLMHMALKKDEGIRTGKLLSHTMLYGIKNYHKIICMTDGGLNPYPNLEQKAQILENAAHLLKNIGYEKINAACVCGSEIVNPKIQATVDADELSKMTSRWVAYSMNVFGPVGFDLAISEEACKHKNYCEEGCGNADILLVPNYETGNGIGKALTYFADAESAGIIVGAKVPIVLVSRSDNAKTKLASIALGIQAGQNW